MPPKSKRVLPGKRYPLNMRTTKELRDKIEEAAMASGRSLVQEVEFRLEQSFRREEDDRRRKEELESFGVKIVEEMQKRETPYMRAVREWEQRTGERAGLLNPKFLEFIKNYEAQGIGAKMRKLYVIPVNNPIPETPEPKVPLPEPKKAPVKEPVRETDYMSSRADMYRQRAAEAKQIAAQENDSSVKRSLEAMASRWLVLAEQVERMEDE